MGVGRDLGASDPCNVLGVVILPCSFSGVAFRATGNSHPSLQVVSFVIPAQAGIQEDLCYNRKHMHTGLKVVFNENSQMSFCLVVPCPQCLLVSGLRRNDGRKELE